MKKAEFEASPSGRLVPTERNQWAFVPNPLPPAEIDLAVLAEPIAQAAQALGELNGISRTLPDPYLLIRPLQVQEALTSSSMEGTYTTLSDLLLVEAGAGEQNSGSGYPGSPQLSTCPFRGDRELGRLPAVAADAVRCPSHTAGGSG